MKTKLRGVAPVCGAVVVFAVSGFGLAATEWVNPAGGAWEAAGNWQGGQVPGALDDANFGLAGTYSVGLGSSPVVKSINVLGGDLTISSPSSRNLQPTDFTIDQATLRLTGGGFYTLGNFSNSNPTGLFTLNRGRLTVSGLGTEIRTNNDLQMGTIPGDSQLDLSGKGVIGVRRLVAGVVPGSHAVINVSGDANNSLFKGKGHIIGQFGSATLNITGEGRFNADPLGTGPGITVGFSDGVNAGTGWVNIDGNISLMNIKGEVRVADGPGSTGMFRVTNGGRAAFSGTNSVPIAMNVGKDGGHGQVFVSGDSSSLRLNGALVINQNDDVHTVRVEDAALINAFSVVYNGKGSNSKAGLVVKGRGATLFSSGNVDIASGAMLVSDNGEVNVGGTLRIGATPDEQAVINFEGGTLHADVLAIDGGNLNLTRGANKVVRAGSVQFLTADSGVIDLADNAMIVDYHESQASPIESIRNAISPTGPVSTARITSSLAAADPNRFGLGYAEGSELPDAGAGLRQFFREAADNTTVLVRYTYRGDANLDGKVDIDDFGQLAARFNSSGRWSQGDFDNNGSVDIDDFAMLAGNFNQQLSLGTSGGLAGRASVPEPVVAGFLAAGALLFGRRRRH